MRDCTAQGRLVTDEYQKGGYEGRQGGGGYDTRGGYGRKEGEGEGGGGVGNEGRLGYPCKGCI